MQPDVATEQQPAEPSAVFPRVTVVAPSSVVPLVELGMGVVRLRSAGLAVRVHRQCAAQAFTFAGDDAERTGAFWEAANDPQTDVIWCARGGYGATRILGELERLTLERGTPPRKLLAGFSDVTALAEFVMSRWGWAALHAHMPAGTTFASYSARDFDDTVEMIRGGAARRLPRWHGQRLSLRVNAPAEPIEGMLTGGNLAVIAALCGTPFQPASSGGRLLFIEDVGEPPYRIDRMLTQIVQAGALRGVRAVILGDFTDCRDVVSDVLRKTPTPGEPEQRGPVRRSYDVDEAIEQIIRQTLAPLGVTVVSGMPVGHGPNHAPLPLGARYRLWPDGRIELDQWAWGSGPGGSTSL